MKKILLFLLSIVLLLSAIGCSNVEETPSEVTPDSVVEDEQTSNESIPAPITLKVTDLISVFDTLDLTEANLTYHGETETTYPASTAIRAEGYIEKLKSFVWEEYTPPAEWNGDLGFFCQLTTPDITITSLQTGYNNSCPLHLITDEGEGWFVLPTIGYEDPNANKQLCWMIYDTFFSWHTETQAAFLYSEEGTPLTAEEMDYFQEYTKATWTEYDAEWGGFVGGATEISCFFTSLYSDPRDINAGEFLAYCPNEDVLTKTYPQA